MISFETRFNEATGLWQYRGSAKRNWSEPMKLGKLTEFLRRETAEAPTPVNSARFKEQWSKPLAHAPKRPAVSGGDWEIHKGKVRRIPASAKEAKAAEIAEIMDILGL